MGAWPGNVGILAIEFIFPSQCVSQTDLEKYDGVAEGKYTVGLGQKNMGFCTDREDINSLCLTVVTKLMERNNLDYISIGHLEVGTESLLDKSKSVKSVLMQLFEKSGNTDIEGVDTINACYGGTAALFNAISWIESSAWDGRFALVVAADIAVYAKGNARPTGGVGAIAMVIGPDAPLILDRGVRSSFMCHAYDFYKPDLSSLYPTVDGKLSIECYLSALDHCYQLYCTKAAKMVPLENGVQRLQLSYLDAVLFHTPYCKLVQKSLARLVLNDFSLTDAKDIPSKFPGLEKFKNVKLEETYFDRETEKAFMDFSKKIFNEKTRPSLLLSSEVGNMYTASLYSGLVSLLVSETPEKLAGKRIGLFSYGSGLASSMYSLHISKVSKPGSALDRLVKSLQHIKPLLEKRECVSPEEFSRILEIREKNHNKAPFTPEGRVDVLFPGTWYLEQVDDKFRRTYKRVPLS